MIMSFSPLISGENDMKTEIPVDQAAAWSRATRASHRTALTVTTHHSSQRHRV
jgi:hypothetical protein